MSIVRWNPKEAAGKALARRTEIAYEECKLDEDANIFKVQISISCKTTICEVFFKHSKCGYVPLTLVSDEPDQIH